jgi:single-strand DNA-binding protein
MHVNSVTLLGRLADDPVRRPLATGGVVVSWRLIVDRPRAEGARRVVDTITCATFDARVRADSATWRRGDLIRVHGSLRRRFWTAGDLRLGRYEVEVYETGLVAPASSGHPGPRGSSQHATLPTEPASRDP